MTQSHATLEWAARVGSSIVTIATDPDQLQGLFHAYADAAAQHGREIGVGEWRPEGGVVVSRALSVADTHEKAWKAAEDSMAFIGDWLGPFGFFEGWRLPGQEGPVPTTLEQMVAAGAMLIGTPDEVGEQVQSLRDDLGVEYVIFVGNGGVVDHGAMLDCIRLFGEQVIPALGTPLGSPRLAASESDRPCRSDRR